MKRVLFLIHDLGYGGAEKVLVNLANNLDKTKFDVTIQTLFDIGVNKQFIKKHVHYIGGWKHYFPKHTKIMTYISPKKLCKMVIKDDYDIVVSFLEGPCARIASAYEGKKVAWIHTEMKDKEEFASAFKSFDEAVLCYNEFDRIISVAETVKERFMQIADLKDSKCEVLYNVNETGYIIEKSHDKQDIIKKSCGIFNLVSVGRLIPVKCFEQLINIHKRLVDAGIKNNLYIVGEGPEHQNLQRQIDELNLNDTCNLLGFDENPYKYVSNADLFVCSSNKEGFSTSVTEALVLGVPVVSTNVSGAKELLGNENEFGVVTDIDEDTLYNGILRMLTEKDLLEHYKKQAEIRGKEFSREKTTKAVEDMFESLR